MFLPPTLILVGKPFDPIFLSISQVPENYYFATVLIRNACFYFPDPSILLSNNDPKQNFVKISSWIPIWVPLCCFHVNMADLGNPRQNGVQNIVMRSPCFGPDFLLHFGRPLAHFWYPLGSTRFPFASPLVRFLTGIIGMCVCHIYA